MRLRLACTVVCQRTFPNLACMALPSVLKWVSRVFQDMGLSVDSKSVRKTPTTREKAGVVDKWFLLLCTVLVVRTLVWLAKEHQSLSRKRSGGGSAA